MTVKVAVATKCPECGKTAFVEVNSGDYLRWTEGEYAQNVFPHLTKAEREQLISGTCEPCFDRMFPPHEDDEPEESE